MPSLLTFQAKSHNRCRRYVGSPERCSGAMDSAENLVAHKFAGRRPVDSPEVLPRKGRSQVTNGKVLIAGVDQRSPWVRRAKDVIAAHLSDLGGIAATSAAERSIIRRAAILTVELERLETRFALANEASDSDLDLYQRTAGNLRRLLEAVGIRRRPRDVTSLGEYLTALPKDPL
jgi:hypothetical protein